MCISHCVSAYCLAIPSSSTNVNTKINSLLANYPSTEISIPKGGGVGKKTYKICPFIQFPHGSGSGKLPCLLGWPGKHALTAPFV